ncbi:MAG TPA: hypothetical protein VE992_04045 [Solirubrobacteraceae bacterium]|nr:hypothetical protein [Solirubrobacteraceae bacterium]
MDGSPDTERLKAEQRQRARVERRLAETAPEPQEARAHARRAAKAAYLKDKLEEREDSERDAGA